MPLKPGDTLHDRYRILDIIGQGGMGAVYRAEDINLGVSVAIKENLFITEEYARQFRREATLLASLRHPNLPRVTDHFVIEDHGQYLVMDFIEGEDLRIRIEQNQALPEQEVLPWFLEICDALAYLHSRTPPIIHRDIKPGNVKISPSGRAILVDFGLAKVAEVGEDTTGGAKAMTPGFSPPEQYGTGPTDARTDVFSLAATLYAALTGAIPEDALERAMGRAALTSVRDRSVKVSQGLALAIEKALSVKPDDRYQSVNEFAVALKAALSSTQETIVSRLPYLAESEVELDVSAPGPLRSRVESEAPRRRRWFGAGLTVVILTTVLLGVLFLRPELARELIGNFAPSSPESPAPTSTDLTSQVAVITETQSDLTPTATLVPVIAEKSPLPSATPTEEPTPAATPLGGGVGQIAFASARSGIPQIYLLNVDSTGLTQLTNMEDGACQPIWSPDGMELVFTSPCPRNREQYVGASLWLLELESMEVTQLPHVIGGGDYDPAWSPDGRRIAFTSVRDRIQQIYVLEVDGETLVRVSSGKARDYQPVWDPRGTQILFSTLRSETTTIWFMPDKGGEATQFSAPTGRDDSHADWSPDGQFILFEREIGGIPRLVVKSFEDRDHIATQLCVEGPHASQPMAEPRWSPDGRWIVFESWPEGDNHNIAIISSSCTNYAELTTDPSVDFDPDWRP